MDKFDLLKDVSVLTTLPEKSLRKLCDKGLECVCHNVLESLNEGNTETIINILIGEVTVTLDNDSLYYKFRPSPQLESMLVETIVSKKDPLVGSIEEGLTSRLLNTYKDLI